MTLAPPQPQRQARSSPRGTAAPAPVGWGKLVTGYFWFILKNVVGWLCILASPVIGVILPGPGGFPLFLIGFALVTFPGKRRLTTRVFRGRRLPIESPLFSGAVTFFSVLVTAALMVLVWTHYEWIVQNTPLEEWGVGDLARLLGISALALPVTLVVSWVGLKVLNYLLSWMPRLRRLVRPMLRRWGVRLLPARRRRIGGGAGRAGERVMNEEILELDSRGRARLRLMWLRFGPWLRRVVTVGLTVAILYMVVGPVLREWAEVEARVGRVNLARAAAAIAMFALSLFLFRTLMWRGVLRAFGEAMPLAAAARVWALGHLARYIPGRSYQVVRMELARPYGPSGPQTNVAQHLEGTLLVLAAVLVGVWSFWMLGWERLPQYWAGWRVVLIGVAVLSPVLLVIFSPNIFYRVLPAGAGVKRRGEESLELRARQLLLLLACSVGCVIFQGLAVWLVLSVPLVGAGAVAEGWLGVGGVGVVTGVGGVQWWMVVGAWAMGWAAGHLATWSPGGIGVREIVFVGALSVLLPAEMREAFAQAAPFDPLDPGSWQDVWWAFLFFLSLLLRLATTAAEFLYAAVATALDWKGMMRFVRGEAVSAAGTA